MRPAISRPPTRWQYVLLTLIGIVAFTYQARSTYDEMQGLIHYAPSPRAPFFMRGYPASVYTRQKEAIDAGLQMGDQVTFLNGQELVSANKIVRIINNMKPGETLVADGTRNGRPMQVRIRLVAPALADASQIALAVMLGIALPWCSLLLGFYVAAARPRDALAWVLLLLLITFSQLVESELSEWGTWMRIPAEIYHRVAGALFPVSMFLFGYYFPARPAWDRKLPWIKWILMAAYAVIVITNTIASVGVSEDLRRFGPYSATVGVWRAPEAVFLFGLIAAGFWLLAAKTFGRGTSPDNRRRLRLLFAGVFVSLMPILILSILLTGSRTIDSFPEWISIPALLLLLLFPLTLAYVIVVDRAMDVRVAIRQGLQYAFARRGIEFLRLVLVGITLGVGYLIVEQSHSNRVVAVVLCVVAVGAAIKANAGLKRMGLWIDRRFFRDAYNAETVLSELSEQVRAIRETQPLMETVCGRISDALHLSRIAVLLERNGEFQTCHADGFGALPAIGFPNGSAVIGYLRRSTEPAKVYFEDESSWLYRTPGLDDQQRLKLADLGAELLLPLTTRDKLLGFIAVGQKRSEEPYTQSDLRILSSVASQTGLALENAQLTTAIASEMAQRERLAREVEIAREVQERLFPQNFPPVAGLDYFGMCRTALGVGGDYYDFLALPESRLGFALGDVAGKGISAALLMASLQASLRGEASRGGDDLAQMITNLNSRVFETSSNNRYATFFYGQFDPATRKVDYVNAGHNPPILFRPNGTDWDVSTLEATGTVVGLLPASGYEQAAVQLNPGDYLVLFTDGISESMNARDEEWGEECLTEVIRACAQSNLPAVETVSRILSAADAFANGAKQHDDMTIVVLRGS